MSEQRFSAYKFLDTFECLGADCEDTCCKGWGMQVDKVTVELYEKTAPELLDAVTTGEAEHIMKRDDETDFCVKYDKGWCKIHADKGTKYLGDACHFFPRITRKFGEDVIMGASLACPETVRKILKTDNAFALAETRIERVPFSMIDYVPEGEEGTPRIDAIQAMIEMAGDESLSPERIMAKITVICQSMETFDEGQWNEVVPFLIKTADSRLLAVEKNENDSYFLIQTLRALIHAAKKTNRPRFDDTFETIEKALGATIDRESLDVMINIGQENHPSELQEKWKQGADKHMAPVLRKWIQAQLAMSSLPFAGFGKTPFDKAVILCVRFATLKLGLMSHMGADGSAPSEEVVVKIIQSLSRFIDHLADPELSMNMYEDAGWISVERLRGLVGDE